jgi:transketolase
MRTSFIQTLQDLATIEDRIFLLTADDGFLVLDKFREKFPNRYLNVGVAEANMINVASGLAMSDKIVYAYSKAHFITTRCYEQIKLNLCYQNTNVKLIGSGGGLTYGSSGATHHSIEDISIMRSLPNMCVICPGDPIETKHAVEASLKLDGPAYIRIGKDNPLVHKKDIDFHIGKGIVLKKGTDLNILTTGNMLETSNLVSAKLEEDNIDAGVISIHTVKPLDIDLIKDLANSGKPIFTVEEHSIIGGLGSAVSEVLAENNYNVPFKRIGLPDEFSHIIGKQNYQRIKFGIDVNGIYNKIRNMWINS